MKEVKIRLDDKSVDILKEVEAIHRDSLINFAIRLLENHPHYKIIKGEIESIEEVSNLDVINETKVEEKQTEKIEEPDATFDEW